MKNLKTLGATVLLAVLLSAPALAVCEPPVPGQIPTDPCASRSTITSDDSTDPGQTETPPAADSVDVVYVAEAALAALLIF